jgi:hypothetical protein
MKYIPGLKINRWTLVEEVCKDKWGQRCWKVQCDCGTIAERSIVALRNSISCGCYLKEVQSTLRKGKPSPRRKSYGESSFNQLYSRYKRRAIEKGVEFSITKEDLSRITKENCFYCGLPPSSKMDTTETYGHYIYNGLDRLDSSLGYSKDNIVPCCTRCNQMKNNMSLKDFFERVKIIYERFINRRTVL